jgi:hypothetical protein
MRFTRPTRGTALGLVALSVSIGGVAVAQSGGGQFGTEYQTCTQDDRLTFVGTDPAVTCLPGQRKIVLRAHGAAGAPGAPGTNGVDGADGTDCIVTNNGTETLANQGCRGPGGGARVKKSGYIASGDHATGGTRVVEASITSSSKEGIPFKVECPAKEIYLSSGFRWSRVDSGASWKFLRVRDVQDILTDGKLVGAKYHVANLSLEKVTFTAYAICTKAGVDITFHPNPFR